MTDPAAVLIRLATPPPPSQPFLSTHSYTLPESGDARLDKVTTRGERSTRQLYVRSDRDLADLALVAQLPPIMISERMPRSDHCPIHPVFDLDAPAHAATEEELVSVLRDAIRRLLGNLLFGEQLLLVFSSSDQSKTSLHVHLPHSTIMIADLVAFANRAKAAYPLLALHLDKGIYQRGQLRMYPTAKWGERRLRLLTYDAMPGLAEDALTPDMRIQLTRLSAVHASWPEVDLGERQAPPTPLDRHGGASPIGLLHEYLQRGGCRLGVGSDGSLMLLSRYCPIAGRYHRHAVPFAYITPAYGGPRVGCWHSDCRKRHWPLAVPHELLLDMVYPCRDAAPKSIAEVPFPRRHYSLDWLREATPAAHQLVLDTMERWR